MKIDKLRNADGEEFFLWDGLRQNDDRDIIIEDRRGNAIDLTGKTIKFAAYESQKSTSEAIAEITCSIVSASAGQIRIPFSSFNTTLTKKENLVGYIYDDSSTYNRPMLIFEFDIVYCPVAP